MNNEFKPFTAAPKPSLTRPIRACMLTYSFYESDGRVMRYAEALAENGAEVDVIALNRGFLPDDEIINGVRVLRIQKREKNERGKYSYFARITKFFFRSMLAVARRNTAKPYDLIHVHSVPDFEVFATIVAKFQGAKIILDIHDIVPEFYAAKFKISDKSLTVRALKMIEKLSASFADHVIIANDLWRDTLTKRSTTRDKCSAFINYPDLSMFKPQLRNRQEDGRFIVIYPGTLNWHQGVDIAIRAVALAGADAPDIEFHIYGEGSAKPQLQSLIEELELTDKVFLRDPLPIRQIAAIMANADLGVVPKRNDSFGGDAFSTKILEFMALGVPVVVADTRIDKHYFDETMVRFFKAGDAADLARTIISAYTDRQANELLTSRAFRYVEQNNWSAKKYDYLAIVNELVAKND